VDGFVDIMRDAIGCALSVIDFLVVLGPQIQIAVIGHQLGKGLGGLDNAIGMLIEHLEKIALTGQQLCKKHHHLLNQIRTFLKASSAGSLTAAV
jgi:hypothetical protein